MKENYAQQNIPKIQKGKFTEPVPDMLQFLIGGSVWNKQTMPIANCYTSNNPSTSNWTMNNWNRIC